MSGPLWLTVDLGNSSCKAALWRRPGPRWHADVAPLRAWRAGSDGELGRGLARFLEGGEPPARAWVSAVADPALEGLVLELLEQRLGAGLAATPDSGLELDVRESHTVGLDRRFAARGAAWALGCSCLVLDAGTALTVDALELRPGRVTPVFRGGAIAPGPELAAAALARAGARLPAVVLEPGVPALGRSTPEAIAAGAVVGFRGAARELVELVGREAGLERAPLALTGGARRFLEQPPLFAPERVRVFADLVHLGLLAAGESAI